MKNRIIKPKNTPGNFKFIEWMIPAECNYSCSYCLTKNDKLNRDDFEGKEKIISQLNLLPGEWVISLFVTGEPFLIPNLLDMTKKLCKTKHKFIITSNISISIEELNEFFLVAEDNLYKFIASYHPEFIKLDDFIEKAKKIKKIIGNKLIIHVVDLKSLGYDMDKIERAFDLANLNVKILPLRFCDSLKEIIKNKKIKKSKSHERFILNKNVCFKNTECISGKNFFVINKNGDAWSCWNALIEADYSGNRFLGNFYKNTFKLNDKCFKCSYDKCNWSISKIARKNI